MQRDIIQNFAISGSFVRSNPYGLGHINSTFEVLFEENGQTKSYILQKINHNVFRDVVGLMRNIELVTSHIKKKIENPNQGTLTVIPTRSNGNYYQEPDGDYWRMYLFIDNAVAYQTAEQEEIFYKSAKAFGRFVTQLTDFDASLLCETIPNFHNTKSRFRDFQQAVAENRSGRLSEIENEVRFILEREQDCGLLVDLQEQGKLPLRVTHNDTKLNNVLFHNETNNCICIVDLDTVMPGLSLNDFGDAIRYGASSAAEDETDLSKVFMRLDLFEAYTKGYLSEANDSLSNLEKDLLPVAAKLMTLECGMRFLGDHLNGDTYFKVHRPNQNLDRARTQLTLVADMERKMEAMGRIVEKYR